jgi:hypothetical protein
MDVARDHTGGLVEEKLVAFRSAKRKYGNTQISCMIMVMEEMQQRSEEQGMRTAGEGLVDGDQAVLDVAREGDEEEVDFFSFLFF